MRVTLGDNEDMEQEVAPHSISREAQVQELLDEATQNRMEAERAREVASWMQAEEERRDNRGDQLMSLSRQVREARLQTLESIRREHLSIDCLQVEKVRLGENL